MPNERGVVNGTAGASLSCFGKDLGSEEQCDQSFRAMISTGKGTAYKCTCAIFPPFPLSL